MSFSRGLTLGIGAGIVLGLVLGTVLSVTLSGRLAAKRAGWALEPVVVAATDIPAGTPVTFDMISQRALPRQFITASVVRPDSVAYVVSRPLLAGLSAGDPLHWRDFKPRPLDAECLRRFESALAAHPSADLALTTLAERVRSPNKP